MSLRAGWNGFAGRSLEILVLQYCLSIPTNTYTVIGFDTISVFFYEPYGVDHASGANALINSRRQKALDNIGFSSSNGYSLSYLRTQWCV